MAEPSLVEYIKDALDKGAQKDAIMHALVSAGWQQEQIVEAFSVALLPEPPHPPTREQVRPPIAPPLRELAPEIKRPNYNSPFSLFLAVTLLVFLWIFANKVVSDSTDLFGEGISAGLITNTLVIIPFLLIAFAIHLFFQEKKEKFKILSIPYFAVSGWLLLKLLIQVSQYILDSQVVYGVYFVLILAVVALTSIVFFVQKYLRK